MIWLRLTVRAALALCFAVPLFALTDTVPAAMYTITGTAGLDTVTISDGPGGTTTISSPTFESVTFTNKTNVVFDGLGGGDSVTFNNANPATGLLSLIVTNVGTVGQLSVIRYSSFGVNATGTVDLDTLRNEVNNLEISTQNGDVTFFERDGLVLGGVSASLAGVRAATTGSVLVFVQAGVLTIAEGAKSGNTSGDVQVSAVTQLLGVAGVEAVRAPAGGARVWGGAITLPSSDVRAAGSVDLNGYSIVVSGSTTLVSDAFGTNSGGILSLVTIVNGTIDVAADATLTAGGSAGADVVFGAPAVSTLGEVVSLSGDVEMRTQRFAMPAPGTLEAPLGRVLFWTYSPSDIVLGPETDLSPTAMEISDEELDRTTAPVVEVQAFFGTITVAAPFTFGSGQELILHSPKPVTATGTGMLSAPTLTIELAGRNGETWTITPVSFRVTPAATVPYSEVTTLNLRGSVPSQDGIWATNDSFDVTPSATTTINIDGNLPAPPALGDRLLFHLEGVTSPDLITTLTPDGYQGSLTSGNRAPIHFENIERFVGAPAGVPIPTLSTWMAMLLAAVLAVGATVVLKK